MEELLKNLSNVVRMIQEVAPQLWAVTVRQIYVQAIWATIFWSFMLVVSIPCLVSAIRFLDKSDNKDKERGLSETSDTTLGWTATVVVIAGWIVISAVCLYSKGIALFLNPQWYAIELLKGLVAH